MILTNKHKIKIKIQEKVILNQNHKITNVI